MAKDGTKNKLQDVRNHLFIALEGLMDEDNPMDVKRAVAISQVATAIINSAKLELQAVNVLGQGSMPSGFLGMPEEKPALPPAKEHNNK